MLLLLPVAPPLLLLSLVQEQLLWLHCLLLPLLAKQLVLPLPLQLSLSLLLPRHLLHLLFWWVRAAKRAPLLRLRAGVLGPLGLRCRRCRCWALAQS